MKVRVLVLSAVAGLLTFVVPDHTSAEQGEKCKGVDARGLGQDLGGGDTRAAITNDGLLKGSTTAHFEIVGGEFPVFTIDGIVTFAMKKGTMTVDVLGTFDVSTGAFNASGPVTGGTGTFAGSSGSLTFAGTQNLSTGAFTETVTGTVCLDKGGNS